MNESPNIDDLLRADLKEAIRTAAEKNNLGWSEEKLESVVEEFYQLAVRHGAELRAKRERGEIP